MCLTRQCKDVASITISIYAPTTTTTVTRCCSLVGRLQQRLRNQQPSMAQCHDIAVASADCAMSGSQRPAWSGTFRYQWSEVKCAIRYPLSGVGDMSALTIRSPCPALDWPNLDWWSQSIPSGHLATAFLTTLTSLAWQLALGPAYLWHVSCVAKCGRSVEENGLELSRSIQSVGYIQRSKTSSTASSLSISNEPI